MRIAMISDIHGNLEALTAVLSQIEQQEVDTIYCLGDVIGYGADPATCLDLVDKHCDLVLMGNHEYAVIGYLSTESYNDSAKISVKWTQAALSDRHIQLIKGFPFDHAKDDLYFVHASPNNPGRWHYILDTKQAAVAFEHLKQRLCFCGHSHVPAIFAESPGGPPREKVGHDFVPNEDTRYIINIGSTGQPRDYDPRACFVTFDTDTSDVVYTRVEYDIATAQRKMLDAGLPGFLSERLAVGR
jgi:diadenosine tetraphosphatase ApaH/serine/threonine PP2A family protein phosphatase